MDFSVLISVYYKENPQFFQEALDSILEQTLLPNEIIIVKDGVLTAELNQIVDNFNHSNISKKVIELKSNLGLGRALAIGLSECSNSLVARADSDDINLVNRFEVQLNAFKMDSTLSIVGAQIAEFYQVDNERIFESKRSVPVAHSDIVKFSKKRNPFNHMTVMFKKEDIVKCGGYKHKPSYEDYDLWMRVLNAGLKTSNSPEVLVHARAGINMAERRGGIKYAHSLFKMRKDFFNSGYISLKDFFVSSTATTAFALFPSSLRNKIYKNILHSK